MSDIAAGVFSALTGSAPVIAAVGDRVYPQWSRISDNTYPLVVYMVEGVTPSPTFGGTNALESCTVQVACIGRTYGEAVTTAKAVRSTLDNVKGTWAGVVVQGSFLNDDGISDEVVDEPQSENILYHIRKLTFLVWYVNA